MPGIVGIVNFELCEPDVPAVLEKMAAPLQYKADQTFKPFLRDWFAGAVIDYGPGFSFLKPAYAEKDNVLLLMEGEVFPDASEVPHEFVEGSPTVQRAEYCLYLYLKEGPKFVRKLNGIFSIAVIDRRDKNVHLYTDRFGHRQMFIAEKSNQFAFATSVRSLLRWRKDIGLEYDKKAVTEFVLFERVLGSRTLFPDIKRFLPATHTTWNNSGLKTEIYYESHCQEPPDNCSSWKDGAEMFLACLKSSLIKRTSDQGTPGLLLSGGLDSRLVMLACPKPVIAASFSASDGQLSLESKIAEKVARVHGIKHLWLPREVDYYSKIAEDATEINEGLSSAFIGCHSLGIHNLIAQAGIQVVMTGDRFDAAFKDFWDKMSLNSQMYQTGPIGLDARRIARLLTDSIFVRRAEHQDLMMLALNDEMKKTAVLAKEDTVSMLEKYCLQEIQHTQNESYGILRPLGLGGPLWQGFTSMGMVRGLASQFPERSPFFDNEMLNLALGFPVSWALKARIIRRAIKLASPKIARILDVNTNLPAGLCPPWDRLIYGPREYIKNAGKYLSRYSKQLAKIRYARSRANVFSSRSWLFSHNATLIQSPLYRELVDDAVNHIPADFFDVANIKKLLDYDLNCGSPGMCKLWHALIAFRSFDKNWGPCAPR